MKEIQSNGVFGYLREHQTFLSVEEMDAAVKDHIYTHFDKLTLAERRTLYTLSRHSLKYPGACHIKADTLANEIGVTTKTVYRAIKKLTELHIIEKISSTRKHGIKGASIYRILPNEMTQNVSTSPNMHVLSSVSYQQHTQNTQYINDSHINLKTQSFNSFNENVFNHSFVNSCNTYSPQVTLQDKLEIIYTSQPVKEQRDFEVLLPVVFGSMKRYKGTLSHIQLEQVMISSMEALIRKKDVRNECAMLSRIIQRQVEQATQPTYRPIQQRVRELVPHWFDKRNEQIIEPAAGIDYEAERAKVLAKLNA
ncbi:HTH domain-containing protein [Lysinibacillus sp. LZ02]|uniref:HTH domain-containing protein n=1 Tax=Lysinibacillus sp. LZ02 TaxID=3420668 RepID=UPI003D359F8A